MLVEPSRGLLTGLDVLSKFVCIILAMHTGLLSILVGVCVQGNMLNTIHVG